MATGVVSAVATAEADAEVLANAVLAEVIVVVVRESPDSTAIVPPEIFI
jgi:hypothetical protein